MDFVFENIVETMFTNGAQKVQGQYMAVSHLMRCPKMYVTNVWYFSNCIHGLYIRIYIPI